MLVNANKVKPYRLFDDNTNNQIQRGKKEGMVNLNESFGTS